MSRQARRAFVRALPDRLELVDPSEWPPQPTTGPPVIKVWRSRSWVVLVFALDAGASRVSVRRTSERDGITWDELQAIKSEIGCGDYWALEVYPPDGEVVDLAPMRHLWLVPSAPAWAWRKR